MHIAVVTLFPALFEAYKNEGLFAKAIDSGIIKLSCVDIRDYTSDKHRTADDMPFGGGAGMVLKPEPVVRAVESLEKDFADFEKLIVSPRGTLFDQKQAERLSGLPGLTILCGRYKGIDGRVAEILDAKEISIGDYVLGAGEIAALAIIDAVVRLIPGYLGDIGSAETDSHSGNDRLLSAPEYTRPREYRGHRAPDVLLSGNHAEIEKWKRFQSLKLTYERRPDLLGVLDLTVEEKEFLDRLSEEAEK